MNYINVTVIIFLKIIFPFQKVILTERNVLLVANRTKRLFRFKIIKILMKISYGFADKIISVSNDVMQDVPKITKINSNDFQLFIIQLFLLKNWILEKSLRDYKEISKKKKLNCWGWKACTPERFLKFNKINKDSNRN